MPKNKNSWFEIKAMHGEDNAGTVDVYIFSEIGGWGITSLEFIEELQAHNNITKINLYINSPGGGAFEGMAIYNTLINHRATVDVFIQGAAFSIASLIALAGDTINMSSNSTMMIHEPHRAAFGTQAELEKAANGLEKITQAMANTYQERSGLDRDEVLAIMKAETWFSAQEALAKGFITNITEDVKIAALDTSTNQEFAAKNFKNLPKAMQDEKSQTGVVAILNDIKALLTSKKEPSAVTEEKPKQQQESNTMKIEDARALIKAQQTANIAVEAALKDKPELIAIAMAEKGIKSPSDPAAVAAAATEAAAVAATAAAAAKVKEDAAAAVAAAAGDDDDDAGQETENAKITALQETQKEIDGKLNVIIAAMSGKVEGFEMPITGASDADALNELIV